MEGTGERLAVTNRPGEVTRTARPTTRPVTTTQGGSRRPAPAPRPKGAAKVLRPLARPSLIIGKYVLPLVVLAALAIGIFYVRLLYGPISLKVLAEPIARSVSAELPGFDVTVDDALVRLNEQGQIEFRLRNVRLIDDDGDAVAMAPLAAVEMSRPALWSMRLAPAKIVLIEPRVLLSYSAEQGLSFSFARPANIEAILARDAALTAAETGASQRREADDTGEGGLPVALRRLELGRLIADASARARQGADAASYLKEIGFRNATVVFEQDAKQTSWLVSQADVALAHRRDRSVIEGDVTIASDRGPWSLHFWTEASGSRQQVALKAAIRDLVPRSVASALPALNFMNALDVPANGEVTLELTSAGELQGGEFRLDLARGRVHLPWMAQLPLDIEGGRLNLRYTPGEGMLRVAPSTLAWGQSRLTIQGQVVSSIAADGSEVWNFDLGGVEGQIAGEDMQIAPLPLEAWVAKGSYRATAGALSIEQYVIQAGGGQMRVSGEIGGAGNDMKIDGQFGGMSREAFLALWPRGLAGDARTWIGKHAIRGRVLGGTFSAQGSLLPGRDPHVLLSMEAADVALRVRDNLPPVDIPRGLVQINGEVLDITVPEASMTTPKGRTLAIKGGRVASADLLQPRTTGQISFRANGPAAALMEMLENETFGMSRVGGLASDGLEGKVDGQLALTLPFAPSIAREDLKIEGRVRLTEGRAKKLVATHDAQAATVNFDITEKAIDARGDMLIAGVPVKLGWQHIFDAPPDRQPPLRLHATLDGSDRNQLGLDVNHVVQGEIPVEVTVSQTVNEEYHIQMRADLTRADMVLDNVAWRKPPGRAATLQFDMEAGAKQSTELKNFQIVGDDIAISGSLQLDANNRLKEFHFPEFSVSVVTRLDVKGRLRSDNVWDITARGQTYDGRDFFRSLFSVGELGETPKTPRKNAPGLELKADIGTVLGFSDVSLRGVTMQLTKRGEKMTQLVARGTLDGGQELEIGIQPGQGDRRLVATTDDAGKAFKLIDFYPSMVGGRLRLDVNLDGRGAAEKTGVLRVERFRILGDPVISEVLQFPDDTRQIDRPRQQRVVRQVYDFDWLRVPFSVGHGQFVMGDSEIRGPVVGATMRGKADFRARQINVGGTYVPLQGLNSAIGVIPGIGQILAGPRGEGILGITFAIQGSMNSPQVLVNPLSLVAPGIFREIFQLTPSQSVTPRAQPKATSTGSRARASSAPAISAPPGTAVVTEPEVLSGWSSETSTTPAKKK